MTSQAPVVMQQTIFNIQLAVAAGGTATPVEATKKVAAGLLRAQGYQVMLGRRNRAYLWYTDGERVARIEARRAVSRVGQSRRTSYTRYQVPIKGHEQAQVLLLLAIAPDGQEHPFFIPMADIGQRRNIAIWSEDPVEYSGQWAPYRNNWEVLAQALAEAPTQPDWGLTLFS